MKLDEKLVTLRKKKGLTQLELAEMMNVSRQAVSRWEVGAAAPSTENLKYLGTLYNVPLEYLLNDDALDPVYMELSNKEERGQSVNKKRKAIILSLVAIGIVIVLFCSMLLMNEDKRFVQMNNIAGSEMETEEKFEMEW